MKWKMDEEYTAGPTMNINQTDQIMISNINICRLLFMMKIDLHPKLSELNLKKLTNPNRIKFTGKTL